MTPRTSSLILFAASAIASHAEVRINEVDLANNKVELVNTGPSAVDMTGWWWCNRATGSPFYGTVTSNSTVDTERQKRLSCQFSNTLQAYSDKG